MAIVKLRINGREIGADGSKTILAVARENGIEIPTLCHDPRLPPYGSCLVCVVEIRNTGRLLMSCTTPVADGMDVHTHGPAAIAARRSALELLLSNHWADCRGQCWVKCPANVDVQGYLAFANAGRHMEALELIRETNPMPLVCGRVCVRYCEANCRRKDVDSPVAINFMKRYVTDLEYDNLKLPELPPKNGKKVAVVGGGPAGLTCAYYLAKNGYSVAIFDKQPKLGGMLRYGIPEYRLPQKLLDREIGFILAHGVGVKTNAKLGADFTLDSLKEQGFDAVFLGLGSWVAKGMGVEGEDNPSILPGITFLEEVKRVGPPELKGTVAIVGGGNTAVDAARTALRCGAGKVVILYRRTRAEMPADPVEIEDAIAEGVQIEFLVAPKKAVTENGKLVGLECFRMELGEPDSSGRRRPVQVKGSDFVFKADWIVSAIGQDQDLSGLKNEKFGEIKQTKWRSIEGDARTFLTSVPGVFTGGDAMTGPAAAIDAIGAGRKAAWVIDRYVQTGKVEPFPEEFLSRRAALYPPDKAFFEGIETTERARMRHRDPVERTKDYAEADMGVDPGAVGAETSRCLTCGCRTVFGCDLKDYSTEFGARQEHFKGRVKRHKVDDRHPFIVLDQNKCVSCGRCVRYCGDVIGVHALGFVNRGFDTVIRPALDKALADTSCIACGNCIEVCPTGAIEFKPLAGTKPGPFKTKAHASVCSFCGVGCELDLNEAGREHLHVTGRRHEKYVEGELCAKGRFATNYLGDKSRIASCSIIGKGKVGLDEAVDAAWKGLSEVKAKHGGDSIAFFVSPRIPVEQLHIIKSLAGRLGSNLVLSIEDAQRGSLPPSLRSAPQSSAKGADLIVTIGTGVLTYNPVFWFKVRKAVAAGAKLVHIGLASPAIRKIAAGVIPAPDGEAAVLSAICGLVIGGGGAAIEAARKFRGAGEFFGTKFCDAGVSAPAVEGITAAMLDPSKKVVFVCNADAMIGGDTIALKWAHDALLLAGRPGSLVIVRNDADRAGFNDVVHYDAPADLPEKAREAIRSGTIKAVFAVGQDVSMLDGGENLLSGLEFLAAADVLPTATTERSGVVIPLAPVQESCGSMVSFDGRVVKIRHGVGQLSGFSNYRWMGALLEKSGGGNVGLKEARAAIAGKSPAYKKITDDGIREFMLDSPAGEPAFFAAPQRESREQKPFKSACSYSKIWEPKVR